MTRSNLCSMILGIVVIAAAMPLHAQMMAPQPSEPAAPVAPADTVDRTVAEVRTDGGVIMISDGGPFQTAVPGQRVNGKARLMVSKESAATVLYDDGCKQKYEKPGIYEISSSCVLPVAAAAAGTSTQTKVVMTAGAVIAAWGIYEIIDDNNDDDNDSSPISP